MANLICDSCCCCIDLRTGCFILGYLQLLNHIGTIGKVLLYSVSYTESDEDIEMLEKEIGISFKSLITIIMLVLAISLSFTITLLVGLHKFKRHLVAIYVGYMTTVYVLWTIAFLVVVVMYSLFLYIIGFVIVMAPGVYFLMVIRSYYYKMGDTIGIAAGNGVVYNAVGGTGVVYNAAAGTGAVYNGAGGTGAIYNGAAGTGAVYNGAGGTGVIYNGAAAPGVVYNAAAIPPTRTVGYQ